MSNKAVRDALENRLKALVGTSVPIAWENKRFAPTVGTAYLSARLLPAQTANPSYGGVHKRESGVYRVNVCFPAGTGSGAAMGWAETLRDGFKRGTSLASGGVTVRILRDPYIAPAVEQPDWYTVPVQVQYQADVLS